MRERPDGVQRRDENQVVLCRKAEARGFFSKLDTCFERQSTIQAFSFRNGSIYHLVILRHHHCFCFSTISSPHKCSYSHWHFSDTPCLQLVAPSSNHVYWDKYIYLLRKHNLSDATALFSFNNCRLLLRTCILFLPIVFIAAVPQRPDKSSSIIFTIFSQSNISSTQENTTFLK